MTRQEAKTFAEDWAAAWNRRDLDAVLSHFRDDVIFTSPKALAAVRRATVRGKDELKRYWEIALRAIDQLRFDVHRVLWDSETRELSIIYDREINGQSDRAAEVLRFDESGKVEHGEAFYGQRPG